METVVPVEIDMKTVDDPIPEALKRIHDNLEEMHIALGNIPLEHQSPRLAAIRMIDMMQRLVSELMIIVAVLENVWNGAGQTDGESFVSASLA